MSDDIRFLDARPAVEVRDLAAALAFWTDVVGFSVLTSMGEPPTFAMIGSSDVTITLVEADPPTVADIASVFVTMVGLDLLVERLGAAGVELVSPVTQRPWGLRDIVVRCPGDGPLVAFGEED